MGGDFYLYTEIVATFEKKNQSDDSITLEKSSQRRYLCYYDSDDETFDQVLDREIKKSNQSTDLYQNGSWVIKNTNKIAYYQQIIEKMYPGEKLLTVQRIQYASEYKQF